MFSARAYNIRRISKQKQSFDLAAFKPHRLRRLAQDLLRDPKDFIETQRLDFVLGVTVSTANLEEHYVRHVTPRI